MPGCLLDTRAASRQRGSNSSGFAGCPDCPVDNASWKDAQEFVRMLHLLSLEYSDGAEDR